MILFTNDEGGGKAAVLKLTEWRIPDMPSSALHKPPVLVVLKWVKRPCFVSTKISAEMHGFRSICFLNNSSRMLWGEAVSYLEEQMDLRCLRRWERKRESWAILEGEDWGCQKWNRVPCCHLRHAVAFRGALVSSLGKFGGWTAWFLKFLPALNYLGSMWSQNKQKNGISLCICSSR